MHVLSCMFLFVLSEAKTLDANDYDDDAPSPLQKKADVYSHFSEPVPFGHITIQGFGDPFSKAKQPIDFLELRMRTPKNKEEAIEILKHDRRDISLLDYDLAKDFLSARDQYLKEIMGNVNPPPERNVTRLKWYDIATIQGRNAMKPPTNRHMPKKMDTPNPEGPKPPAPLPDEKRKFFEKGTFGLYRDRPEVVINWTTCDQFAVGAIFSPKDIVNLKWTPFFIWSTRSYAYAIEHSFEYPTKKLVNEYHSKYNKFLNKTVDWSHPKLLMKGMEEMLLIAADKRGLFDAIAKHEIPESAKYIPITLPSLSLRMKIEDPYLVITYCEDYYAAVMAISGKQPTKYKDMKDEAATINFVGTGRPVWRDYEGEKERIKLEQDAKLQAERDKIIIISEPQPSIGQWD